MRKKEPVIENPKKVIGITYVNEAEAYEAFHAMLGRAYVIARCGDFNSGENVTSSGSLAGSDDSLSSSVALALPPLALYVKALSVYNAAIVAIAKYKQEYSHHQRGQQPLPEQFNQLSQHLTAQFQHYFKKADRIRKHIQESLGMSSPIDEEYENTPSDEDDDILIVKGKRRGSIGKVLTPEPTAPTMMPMGPAAEKLIYDWALKLAKDAAVEEMMGNPNTAIQNYRNALRLLEQLTLEPSVDEHDLAVLNLAMVDLQNRIDLIHSQHIQTTATTHPHTTHPHSFHHLTSTSVHRNTHSPFLATAE
eukprot:TRINITY_DN4644_c0_g1_i16.p1 TRINITY_DN4644_c0_g1~~TRINITY_DN4644_c0_g1_i16.p1  ORF type:complete len:340 (-),score=57.60 TRINITY_DN4644_c0_g1_i16:201-1118(-)